MPETSEIGSRGVAACPSPALLRARAFTLVELMVVLAILVLLAASMPLVLNRALPGRRVAAASDRLAADVRWLQTQSVMTGLPATIHVVASGYRMDLNGLDRSRSVVLAKSTSLKLSAREDGRVLNELMIYPDGTTSAGRFEVSDAGRRASVEIGMLTGRILRAR